MSLRNKITEEIVRVLREIEDPRPVLVTREPFEVTEIAITQFPALLITPRVEERETVTLGRPSVGRRTGTITYDIRAFVRGNNNNLDQSRSELLEAIEEQLERDRYLDLRTEGVMDSQISRIEIQPRMPPIAEILIEVTVRYSYLRGQT